MMFSNSLKTALRNLRRHPGYAAVNLVGLGVGMACCILILQFVRNEYAVNRHFEKESVIYRINSVWHDQGDAVRFLSFSPLSLALKTEFSGVANALRYTGVDADIRAGETPFRASILIAGPELFDLFDFTFIAGSSETALRQLDSVVLTEAEAARLFGRPDVLGETIRVSTWRGAGERPYRVTGVIESPPYNSITYIGQQENRVFVPFANASDFFADADFDGDWSIYNTITYAQLEEGARPEDIEEQLPAFLEERLPPALHGRVSLQLEPLREVYLNDFSGSARRLSRLLFLVALLIMGVACFNYINVSTALAVVRAKEVGMRKVLGASRLQLIGQYVGESVLACVLGMILAIALAQLGIEPFNAMVERTLELAYAAPGFWLMIGGLALLLGVLGGLYPAFYLASAQPADSLKTLSGTGKTAGGIRRALVVVQFTVAIGLFIAALIVNRQATFVAQQDTGFDRERVLVVSSLPREWTADGVRKLDVIKQAMLDIPGIEHLSIAWGPPGPRFTGITGEFVPEGGDAVVPMPISQVDAGFLETMGIELASGEFFDPDRPVDEPVVVLNEAAVRSFGWDTPLGRYIEADGVAYRVLGVVEDYHTEGLDRPIGPVALVDVRQSPLYREMLIRLPAAAGPDYLDAVRAAWYRIYPGVSFDYYFLDRQWHELHKWIWRTQTISGVATALAIFVACLGLIGIVSISVGQRTREIGIRKVLGANLSVLVRLLSADFIRLVGVAFVVAAPLAYILMRRWLEGFAYRIDIKGDVFVFGGAVVFALASITVFIQTLRAAIANPVDVLRDE